MIKRFYALATSVHHRLLPANSDQGVLPYLWLVYLGIYFVHFAFYDPPAWHVWVSAIGTLLFLACYFRAYWTTGFQTLFYIAAICAIGSVLTLVNPGAGVFFVYASAFAAHAGPPKQSLATIGVILAYIVLLAWLRDLSAYFYVPALIFSIMIGGANVFQREIAKKNTQLKLTQDEVKRLATTAERERIARDLHDLIGHTFSMLTMKAQLAQKLFDHDTDKARQEIAELEQISRRALTEVREAVTGYRQKDLATELANAKTLLNSVEVDFDYTIPDSTLPANIDTTLGFIVREAITNLVKHANATRCQITLNEADRILTMHIADNGSSKAGPEGNGLKGMRERLAPLGGKLTLNSKQGFNIILTVPL
ncbi:sensor histidine kinase [Alteromonas sp. H39]|uniref:sensor histidine kinase n=1 Tax=Alteromonas sp. H39 TaxID=3389876 RepID=UPI0039E1CBCD